MPTSYTTNLGLALPVTSELAGTWGNVVNTEITELLDNAIAGTTTLSSDADVTLTTTTGAANQSRQAILLWTANGTATRTITAPARTKAYIVINATGSTQSIKLVGAGPTTGITVVAGEKCVAAWNGSDFVKVASTAISNLTGATTVGTNYLTLTNPSAITFPRINADNTVSALSAADFRTAIGAGTGGGSVTSVDVSGGTTGLTTSGGPITGSGTITLAGTLGVANGGTGATTLTANNVLLGNGTSALQVVAPGTSGNVLTSNGTTWTSAAPAATLTGQTNSASPYETSLGVNAGANNTGLYNVFIGYDAGAANTSATQNVAIGYQAMDANTTGAKNIAIGRDALGAANGASENVAIGVGAGFAVTTGTQNVIIGQQSAAGGSNNLTSGANNILIGYQAAASSATVSNETTIGNSSTTAFRLFGDLQLQRDYTEKVATANTGTAYTINIANGTLQILTLTGNCTFTFPTATAGKSFMLFLKQDATGSRTVTWPSSTNPVKWPGGTAPTITATANKMDKFVFTADGTNWIGSNAGQNYL